MEQLLWIEDISSQVEKDQLLAQIDDRYLKLVGQQAQVKQHQVGVVYLTGQTARFLKPPDKNNLAVSQF